MIKNDRQLGKPFGLYQNTKANIEALTGLTGGETAYATDTGEDGVYDAVAVAWVWGRSGGSGDVAGDTHAATSKTTPVDDDEIPLVDSAASWVLKKLTWANLKATLKTYNDTLYATNEHDHIYIDAILAYASVTSQVPAGSTYYFFPHLTGFQSGIGAIIYPVAGTMKNMAVRLSSTQPGTGSLVITLMKNLVATSLVITIAAGTAGGTTHVNTVNTVEWNANDLLTWRIVNNASSTSGSLTSFVMRQERSTT